MELQFRKKALPCMREILSQCREQELTQEVRLPDGMPDIGKVLGAWGQVLVRGKEWRPESIGLSGGLMVWIMYMDEDGVEPHVVETWLPFHSKWEIPDVEHDGNIMASAHLSFADARSISARKFMLRAGICMNVRAYIRADAYIYEPEENPHGLQFRKVSYPVKLPAEMGEKTFSMEEHIPLPSGCPEPEKIIRYSLQPQIMELKVLGGRVVFRGVAVLHLLYKSGEGMLCSCDVDLPFSQYAQLDREYEEGAEAVVRPVVTNLELDLSEDKKPVMKAGLSGQYMIRDRTMLEIVEDAYSPEYEVKLHREQLQIPNVLEEKEEMISADRSLQVEAERIADMEFIPLTTEEHAGDEGVELQLGGRFQVLYYDPDGKLQSASAKWDRDHPVDMAQGVQLRTEVRPEGKSYASVNNGLALHGEMMLESTFGLSQGLEMVRAIEIQEAQNKSTDRPSMIIRRAGEDDLWTIAKESGSTVDAIRTANSITDEPSKDQILLIPVI